MRFKISVFDMKRVVSLIRDVVPSKSVTQEGGGLLVALDKGENTATFTAVGSDVVVRVVVAVADVSDSGFFVVNSGLISGVVGAFTSQTDGSVGTDDMDISLQPKTRLLTILSKTSYRSGKAVKHKRTIPTLNAELFPSLPKYDGDKAIKLPGYVLKDGLEAVGYATSTAPDAGVLGGIRVQIKGGSCFCAATDGVRLAEYTAVIEETGELEAVVPAKLASKVSKCILPTDSVQVVKTNSMFWVRSNDVLIGGVVLLGTFPDYGPFLSQPVKEAVIDKELLVDNIRNVDFTELSENRVNLRFKEGLLHVLTPCAENDCIPVGFKEDLAIDFNIKLLRSTVQALSGPTLVLGFTGAESVAIFRSADTDRPDVAFRSALMPMHLLDE